MHMNYIASFVKYPATYYYKRSSKKD